MIHPDALEPPHNGERRNPGCHMREKLQFIGHIPIDKRKLSVKTGTELQ